MLEWHNRAEIEPHHHSPLMAWLSLTPPVLITVSHDITWPFFFETFYEPQFYIIEHEYTIGEMSCFE